jgi:hypothetical protein
VIFWGQLRRLGTRQGQYSNKSQPLFGGPLHFMGVASSVRWSRRRHWHLADVGDGSSDDDAVFGGDQQIW